MHRCRPLWEDLIGAWLCKWITQALCGIRMGEACWLSRKSGSKVHVTWQSPSAFDNAHPMK